PSDWVDHIEQLAVIDKSAQVLRKQLTREIIEGVQRPRRGGVKCQGYVLKIPQRTVGIERFGSRHIKATTTHLTALERFNQRLLVDYLTASNINQISAGLGGTKLCCTKEMARSWRQR